MGDKIKQLWEYCQDLMDVSGDSIMAVMSTVFIVRVAASMFSKFPPLTASEAAMYASAIGAFSYSNKGPKS
jgi:hypothetical protein